MPHPAPRIPGTNVGPTGGRRYRAGALVLVLLTAAYPSVRAGDTPPQEHGLPFTRFYSFDEIGRISRGARLGFDPIGRIAVSRAGSCAVLNDTTWIDLADRSPGNPVMEHVVFGPRGEAYYSAFGTFGLVRMLHGKLHPQPLAARDGPRWLGTANFNMIVPVGSDEVYFGSPVGVVRWQRSTGALSYHELNAVARVFAVESTLFASTHLHGLHRLDVATGAFVPVETTPKDIVVDEAAPFDGHRALLSANDGRMFVFDGETLAPFPAPGRAARNARVTALRRLPNGNFAAAINGAGIYLFSPDGRIVSSLTTADYHRVTDLAARENGVLWAVTETGVDKILYHSALTSFGQRQGLPLSWPQLVRWQDRIIVASGGRLYESVDESPGDTTRFRLLAEQPDGPIWGLATDGNYLLFGTNQAVYARSPAGRNEVVLADVDAARLVRVDDVFIVLGSKELTAVRQREGQWEQCAPRIPGLGYPMIVHATPHAAWVELGPNRAARVHFRDGELRVRVFEQFPWQAPRWINIGWIGDVVALSGMPEGRVYFDERTEQVVPAPEYAALLDAAPFPSLRFQADRQGTIWATHEEGVFTIQPDGPRARYDATTFGRMEARFPLAQILPDGDVWLVTGQSLHHVNRQFVAAPRPVYQPALVSLTDGRTGRERLAQPTAGTIPSFRLHPEENNLVLRFFAGTYAARQPPRYEFRLCHGLEDRVVVGNASLLTLSDLGPGEYLLHAQLTDGHEALAPPLAVTFAVAPPWYRTPVAYGAASLAALAAIVGLVRWSGHRSRARHAVLERLVTDRTEELRATMRKLNEEIRNAATLAERDRLAGEIHDSVQQGLSGLMLHLDATLKLPDLPADVRSRLSVARNMVSFTRHEVQHAVWDLESPLLADTELGEALKRISALIGPGAAEVRVTTTGRPVELPSATKHHLLRIAQEAITNAVRHAAARVISITLAYEPGGVVLRITDDGNGFVPEAVLAGGFGHFGLRALHGRAEKIGGELQIQSTPGQGTTVAVSVQIPLGVR